MKRGLYQLSTFLLTCIVGCIVILPAMVVMDYEMTLPATIAAWVAGFTFSMILHCIAVKYSFKEKLSTEHFHVAMVFGLMILWPIALICWAFTVPMMIWCDYWKIR